MNTITLESSTLSYAKRKELCTNETAKKLFNIMEEKCTNLAVAVDVTTKKELLYLANLLGPEICILKTHIDIIEDFTPKLTQELLNIAKQHNFIIFEDRKFADIGNTVKMQYQKGIYNISNWASIINAHTLPGPGIIEGLKQVGQPLGHGLLLLAQMSSKDNLFNENYTKKTLSLAKEHSDFVIGFIAQQKLTDDPRFIHLTPGINLGSNKDSLGQQYNSPENAIKNRGTDIIIVGRGIIKDDDPLTKARLYKKASWQAYNKSTS